MLSATHTADTDETARVSTCRLCGAVLRDTLVDLGSSPPCESFLTESQLNQVEPFYPLHVWICGTCLLAQLEAYVDPEDIFTEYAYFSAYSQSWVDHARRYTDMIVDRCRLGPESLVVELASNDGYLLQHFVERGIPSLGIDPAANVAAAAEERGVETLVDFFGTRLASELVAERGHASLVVGNNVLAQVPDLNDFVEGMRILLAPEGTGTIEVPHLVRLIEGLQFDTIYHEHYSYFSLTTLVRLFEAHELELFDVEELPSHGGSLRVYVRRADGAHGTPTSARVADLLASEREKGYATLEGYRDFQRRVDEVKWQLLELLIGLRRQGKHVVGYGAPGKGNTLLNFCGVRTDLLEYTVDRNPYKHGRFLPGTHIPIHPPETIDATRPDYIVVLPWNLQREIAAQLAYTQEWGARLVVPIPQPTVVPWPEAAHEAPR
jgi:SAM-dependent methyltransferase